MMNNKQRWRNEEIGIVIGIVIMVLGFFLISGTITGFTVENMTEFLNDVDNTNYTEILGENSLEFSLPVVEDVLEDIVEDAVDVIEDSVEVINNLNEEISDEIDLGGFGTEAIWYGDEIDIDAQWGAGFTPLNNTIFDRGTVDINFTFNATATGIHNKSLSKSGTNAVLNLWFEQNSSDVSGLGNDGTISGGVTNTTGIIGSAYSFDGLDGHISVGSDASLLRINESITISAWIKPSGIAFLDTYGSIVSGDGGANLGFDFILKLNTKHLYWYIDGVGNKLAICSDINYNSWNHIGATWEWNDTGHIRPDNQVVYVNGKKCASWNTTGKLGQIDTEMKIGGGWGLGTGYNFNGSIDELLIFNRSLSSGEISALYNDSIYGEPRDISNCSLWLKDNEDYWKENASTDYSPSGWENLTDGIDLTSINWLTFTIANPRGFATNGSDFWIGGSTTNIIYQLNSSLDNQTEGIAATDFAGAIIQFIPTGIATNGTDLWIMEYYDRYVYHLTRTNTGGYPYWANETDGFKYEDVIKGTAFAYGLTSNGTDLWMTDDGSDYVFHVAKKAGTWTNITDGFSLVQSAGANPTPRGITTNGSDFWIVDDADDWVYHVKADGTNVSDGFDYLIMAGTGGTNDGGITADTLYVDGALVPFDPEEFWFTDSNDLWLYHAEKVTKESNNYTFKINFSNIMHDVGWKIGCYDELHGQYNSSEMHFDIGQKAKMSKPNIGSMAYYDPKFVVGMWSFERNGTGAIDTTGKNNGSLKGGVKWVPDEIPTKGYPLQNISGRIGKAYYFDGKDDYIEIADDVSLRFDANTEDFSISTWIRRDSSGAFHNIINKLDGANDGWALILRSSDEIRMSVNTKDVDSTSTITDTNWHHIVATIDRDGNGQMYLDGKADGSAVAISSESMATTINPRIGTSSADGTGDFNGTIDEVIIWNRSLSANEIKQLYYSSAESYNSTYTVQDIAVAVNNTADADNDTIKYIYNWYKDNTSIAVLNMPFEAVNNGSEMNFSKDYSGRENHGSTNFNSSVLICGATVCSGWNRTGGFDGRGAYGFDGVNDYINLGDPTTVDFGSGGFTLSAWTKQIVLAASKGIIAKDENNPRQFILQTDAATDEVDFIVFDTDSTYKRLQTTNANRVAGKWHHIVATSDGAGTLKVYTDGIENTGTGSGTGDGSMQATAAELRIGSDVESTTPKYFTGTIDEVLIFDRALSASQVLALYRNQTHVIKQQETGKNEWWHAQVVANDGWGDSLPYNTTTLNITEIQLAVSQTFPHNNSNWTTNYINFTYNFTDFDEPTGVSNCSLFIEKSSIWERNSTSYYPTEGINQSFNITIEDGTYKWIIGCYDVESEQYNSTKGAFTITSDILAPVVELQIPKDNTNSITYYINFTFNVTDETSDIDSCILWLKKSGIWELNYTDTIITEIINQSINLTMDDGSISWLVECNDTIDNRGNSSTYSLKVDTTAPVVALQAPVDKTHIYYDGMDFIFNVSDETSSIDSCTLWMDIDGAGFEANETLLSRWGNQSDIIKTGVFGTVAPRGITKNSTTFMITDFNNNNVYFISLDGTTGGELFTLSGVAGATPNSLDIVTNNSDFWILDQSDEWVYHTKADGTNVSLDSCTASMCGGFSTAAIGSKDPEGLVYNNSDFWIIDSYDDYIYHVNRSGDNQTDGIKFTAAGATPVPTAMTGNGSDFWIYDHLDFWIYHIKADGTNVSDGFDAEQIIGEKGQFDRVSGILSNKYLTGGSPTSFWLMDAVTSDTIYHYNKYIEEIVNQTLSKSFSEGNYSVVWKIGCYDTRGFQTNTSTNYLVVYNRSLVVRNSFPKDLTRSYVHSVNFTYNTTAVNPSYINISNCSLFVKHSYGDDWERNKTDAGKIESVVNQTFNITLDHENVYWKVGCYNNLSEQYNSTVLNLTVYNIRPIVYNEFPENNTWSYVHSVDFTYNATSREAGTITNCSLLLSHDGGNWERNKTDGSITEDISQSLNITLMHEVVEWKIGCYSTESFEQGNSSSFNYTVLIEPSGPSGTSDSGLSAGRFATIMPDLTAFIEFFNPNIPVISAELRLNREAPLILEARRIPESLVEKKLKDVYAYFEIAASLDMSYFDYLKINFKVKKDFGDIVLYQLFEEYPYRVDFEKLSDDEEYNYYQANINIFGYFGITKTGEEITAYLESGVKPIETVEEIEREGRTIRLIILLLVLILVFGIWKRKGILVFFEKMNGKKKS